MESFGRAVSETVAGSRAAPERDQGEQQATRDQSGSDQPNRARNR